MASNDGQYLMHVASFCHVNAQSMIDDKGWQGFIPSWMRTWECSPPSLSDLHHPLLHAIWCPNHGATRRSTPDPWVALAWLGRNLLFVRFGISPRVRNRYHPQVGRGINPQLGSIDPDPWSTKWCLWFRTCLRHTSPRSRPGLVQSLGGWGW